jgi:hypothetical protein
MPRVLPQIVDRAASVAQRTEESLYSRKPIARHSLAGVFLSHFPAAGSAATEP